MSDKKVNFINKTLNWMYQNIKYVAFGIILGISILLILEYIEYKEEQDNIIASDLYFKLISENSSEDDIKNKIFADHKDSIYEVLLKFILAKKEFENKNLKESRNYLNDIIRINKNKIYNNLAHIKLSLIFIEERKYNKALKQLDIIEEKTPYKKLISEIKGDIYKFKGDYKKSIYYYDQAIKASALDNDNLLMKLNSVKE